MGSFTWLDTQTATPHQHEVANSLEATAATEEGNLGLWKDYIRESPSRLYCERVAGKNKRHDAYKWVCLFLTSSVDDTDLFSVNVIVLSVFGKCRKTGRK
jgi:hypothetical protein